MSPKKIALEGRDPSSAMGFRGCAYCEREIYARDLFPIVDTLTSITAYRRTLDVLYHTVSIIG